jgi:hypothetical protein
MGNRLLTVPAGTVPAQPASARPMATPPAAPTTDAVDLLALLAAADADADRLGDCLHDGALQALVAARYAADAVVRGGDPVAARDAVQEALTTLRQVVWLLRPRGAEDLPAALAELSGRLPHPLRLDVDAELAAQLSPAARALAYRFVQGLAGPAVSLSCSGSFAVLTVDGELADVAGWSARARAVDGRLDRTGGPARLLLRLPHPDPEDHR